MKPAILIILTATLALATITWYGYQRGQKNIPMTPADHFSTLSNEDYRNGLLREKDVLKRMQPRLTNELAEKGLHLGNPIFIRIFKESRELELWVQQKPENTFKLFKTWKIAAMSGQLGPKLAEGDFQAPEGFYYVSRSQMKPDSSYHLAFNIGYPNTYDKAHGRTGSFIMVHGNQVSAGCFAMTDPGIEEIYTLCSKAHSEGQQFFRVHIFPFRMTDQRMHSETQHRWHGFWTNLKQGYDWFEHKKLPPNVTVKNKQYQFR